MPGKILGRDNLLDLGLAKITNSGPWPHVDLGRTTDAKVGDLCYALGFPNLLRKNRQFPCVVRVNRVEDLHNAPGRLLTSCKLWDGDSGGGLLTASHGYWPCMGAVRSGNRVQEPHAGGDYFQSLWPLLVHGPSPGDPVLFRNKPHGTGIPQGDRECPRHYGGGAGRHERRHLGTVVSSDGYILTKASELYGRISCRFADGRTLPASMRKTSREHDLTLLSCPLQGCRRSLERARAGCRGYPDGCVLRTGKRRWWV